MLVKINQFSIYYKQSTDLSTIWIQSTFSVSLSKKHVQIKLFKTMTYCKSSMGKQNLGKVKWQGKILIRIISEAEKLSGTRQTKSPDGIYLFKVNNGNTRTMCEIRSKLRLGRLQNTCALISYYCITEGE